MKNISNQLIPAICDALLQSLWLGIVLAAAAGLMVLCTRHSTARLRYKPAGCRPGLFYDRGIGYFLPQNAFRRTGLQFCRHSAGIHPATGGFQRPVSISYYDTITGLLYEHAGSIVLVWSLIVMARTVRLLTGLQSLYLLRSRHISTVGGDWEQRVIQISKQLGIKRLVGIAESGIAQMPMVVGHLKPLILIPAGMITAFASGQYRSHPGA